MWTGHANELNARMTRITLQQDGRELTYNNVLKGWIGDAEFRSFFTKVLADVNFQAYRWEMPAVTRSTRNRDFECVLLDAPTLVRRVDPAAFANQFQAAKSDESVIAFPNLSGDAMMIVPKPLGPKSAYGHLASFLRGAPEEQSEELWSMVGRTLASRLDDKPVWLSTAGMGVSWLHVRLDSRPKYYGYRPYRET